MFTHEEQAADQLSRIADALGTPAESKDCCTAQLARIADALERIAAALEPNRKSWTTQKEDETNLHSLLYQLTTTRTGRK